MTDTRQALAALLPCPFCGNSKGLAVANENPQDLSGGYFIACPSCDASTGLRFACGEDPIPLLIEQWNRRAALSAQPVAGAVATEPSEEIQELRAQVEAWRKLCETLTNQVICCGVAARHPDATLTTRGAYAGKWNSPQAEEVRKLRAERDALLAASPQPEPSAQAVALPKDVRDFLQSVAEQPKSKPDYWSSCGQCESNQSKAEDLLAASTPPAVVEAGALTDEQVRDAAKYAGLDWQRGYVVDDIHNRYEDFARAIERAHGIAPRAAQEKT